MNRDGGWQPSVTVVTLCLPSETDEDNGGPNGGPPARLDLVVDAGHRRGRLRPRST